jgi:hypothetical protein
VTAATITGEVIAAAGNQSGLRHHRVAPVCETRHA